MKRNYNSIVLPEHIENWYCVKPFARVLFNEHPQEIYWIKNAWLYLLEGIPAAMKRELDVDTDNCDTISNDIKIWLLSLYDLYWEFKKAVNFDPYDYDMESWAENIGLDPESLLREELSLFSDTETTDSYDALQGLIKRKRDVFVSVIQKRLSLSGIFDFFLNIGEALPFDLFASWYCRIHELEIKTYDQYCFLEETEYREYCNDIEIQISGDYFDWKYAADEWVSMVFGKHGRPMMLRNQEKVST